MSKSKLLAASAAVLLLSLGGAASAAAAAEVASAMRGGPDMMQNADASGMAGMRSGEARGQGMMDGGMMGNGMMGNGMIGNGMMGNGMMGGRMMGGGMMNMMNSCPMMQAGSGADRKMMMQMHGEMMRAMGDIMIKYADKLDAPSSSK